MALVCLCSCASVAVEPTDDTPKDVEQDTQPDYGPIVNLDIDDSPGDLGDVTPPSIKWLGKECSEHLECSDAGGTGYCTQLAPDGGAKVCAAFCEDGCAEGLECVGIRDPESADGFVKVCSAPIQMDCRECTVDQDCLLTSAWCVPVATKFGKPDKRCVQDCAQTGGKCGGGTNYQCTPYQHSQSTKLHVCLPISGSCQCMGGTLTGDTEPTYQKACANTNTFGECKGAQICNPDQGWSECNAETPADDICDGLDNNCNGNVDEGFKPFPCEEKGCKGMVQCKGEFGKVCDAPAPDSNGKCPGE